MTPIECEKYVEAALALHGVRLTAEQLQRVGIVFQRNADIASQVVEFELPRELEVAPRFEP